MKQVAALFVRADSIYKTMPGVDCWDAERDAMKWPGGCPVVAHPPCRLWGSLKHMSTAPKTEKHLARFAVKAIRANGGCLEHPAKSGLWTDANLPYPNEHRENEFTVAFPQYWFGHPADKPTWIWVCGMKPCDLPPITLRFGEAEWVMCSGKAGEKPPQFDTRQQFREHTPPRSRHLACRNRKTLHRSRFSRTN